MKPLSLAEKAASPTELPTLEPLEIHSGMIFGRRRTPAPPSDMMLESSGIRESLEELLIPALSKTPCLVAFSGGRDSSALLAMATHVARSNGLELPVPITFRFDQHSDTWESEWQEEMVRHLGLNEWEIVSIRSELDSLGTMACDVLRRHGLYWPSNSHSIIPLLKAAAGGALIHGNGGDELFTSLIKTKQMSLAQIFRTLPLHRALRVAPVSILPTSLRIRAQYRRGLRLPWLRVSARRAVMRSFVANSLQRASGQRHYLELVDDSRYLELARAILKVLARDTGVELCQPFLDPSFFKAVLAQVPKEGYRSRNAALQAFFGDLLPKTVAQRTTKAKFTEVFWGPGSREFARRWDGTGLDHSLIDPKRLKREWLKGRPDARSNTSLHAAWLATQGRSS